MRSRLCLLSVWLSGFLLPSPTHAQDRAPARSCNALYDDVQRLHLGVKDLIKNKPGKSDPEAEIPPAVWTFLRAGLAYVERCPGEDEIRVRYAMSRVYYAYDRFEQAFKGFDEITRVAPGNELAPLAAQLALDCLNLLQDFPRMEDAGRRYRATPALVANQDLKQTLDSLMPKIRFRRLTTLSEQNPSKAARGYLSFVEEFPGDDLAPDALYNAGVLFTKAEDRTQAELCYWRLLRERPKDAVIVAAVERLFDLSPRPDVICVELVNHWKNLARDNQRANERVFLKAVEQVLRKEHIEPDLLRKIRKRLDELRVVLPNERL